MPLFYHKYVNYVLAHSVNYVITLYRLAPPVAPILVVSTNLCKRTLITCLARSSRYTEPLNPHNLLKSTSTASPRTTSLPPLEKGEVLSPEKIRATTGGIAFLPHQLFSKPHYPLPRTTSLPPLEKGEVARL